MALNRSPSTWMVNCPFWISIRFFAMDRPSPLPWLVRDSSPRLNRSINSSAEMFNS